MGTISEINTNTLHHENNIILYNERLEVKQYPKPEALSPVDLNVVKPMLLLDENEEYKFYSAPHFKDPPTRLKKIKINKSNHTTDAKLDMIKTQHSSEIVNFDEEMDKLVATNSRLQMIGQKKSTDDNYENEATPSPKFTVYVTSSKSHV